MWKKKIRKEKKKEKKMRITCYVNGNCDRFFDDFLQSQKSYYPNIYKIISSLST